MSNDETTPKKSPQVGHVPAAPNEAGEDDGSAAREGNEDHLKEDQKTPR
jgi:hypothetical protein